MDSLRARAPRPSVRSGGERKRVAVATALLQGTPLATAASLAPEPGFPINYAVVKTGSPDAYTRSASRMNARVAELSFCQCCSGQLWCGRCGHAGAVCLAPDADARCPRSSSRRRWSQTYRRCTARALTAARLLAAVVLDLRLTAGADAGRAVRQQLDAGRTRGRPPASATLFGAVRRAPRTAAARFTPWFTPQGPTKENGLAPFSANPLICWRSGRGSNPRPPA